MAKRHEPNGVLSINGAALALFKEIITEYGGFNRIFDERHILI